MTRMWPFGLLIGFCLTSCLEARAEMELAEPAIEATGDSLLCAPDDGCSCFEDCCDEFCNCDRILGMLPSDHCFDRFISPISNPFFFEDPRQLTEVRGIFLENSLPSFVGSGDAQVWAVQLRGRLSKNLSVIAPR